ncbi:MAG TPA: hydrolase [Bacteroidales bacterium]|nr:hydrolase [Bacteroidales bacterium]
MIRVAVDFDGTIVENDYPQLGKPMLFAFETLKELQKRGFTLILWTIRTGKLLDEAVEFCRQNGVEFYAINQNHPEEVFDASLPRKIEVDVFIDDRNLGGFPGWEKVFSMLCPNEPYELSQKKVLKMYKRKGFLRRILGI